MQNAYNIWEELILNLGKDTRLGLKLWKQIEKAYQTKGRYYHTLEHINRMLDSALKFKDSLHDLNNLLLSIFYHDIVYVVRKSDNEERSSDMALKHLLQLHFTNIEIDKCRNYILATKSHTIIGEDEDLNYFLDFDLEILGKTWSEYEEYTKQIRQEYKIYPNLIYYKGRKKVLEHFLNLEQIFKTKDFYNLYEEQARKNISAELLTI